MSSRRKVTTSRRDEQCLRGFQGESPKVDFYNCYMIIRYYNNGWYHAEVVKRGRKWVTVRDLFQSRRKQNEVYVLVYRVRKIPIEHTAPALWENRR